MAYTTATIIANNPTPDQRRELKVRFTGNAGEPAKEATTYIDAATTVLSLRQWALAQVALGDNVQTIGNLPALQVGQSITLAPLPAPPAPTAEQVWLEKARRLVRAQAIGLTQATAIADLSALQADVDATYLTAYLAKI